MISVSCTEKQIDQSIEGSWYYKYGNTYYTKAPKWLELQFSEQSNEVTLIPHLKDPGDSWVETTGTYTRTGDNIIFNLSFKTEAIIPTSKEFLEGNIMMGPDKPITITVKYKTYYRDDISVKQMTFSRDKIKL